MKKLLTFFWAYNFILLYFYIFTCGTYISLFLFLDSSLGNQNLKLHTFNIQWQTINIPIPKGWNECNWTEKLPNWTTLWVEKIYWGSPYQGLLGRGSERGAKRQKSKQIYMTAGWESELLQAAGLIQSFVPVLAGGRPTSLASPTSLALHSNLGFTNTALYMGL